MRFPRTAIKNRSGAASRAVAVALVVLALLPSLLAFVCGCERPASRPSVVLITLDTTRPDRLGLYGHARATPSLDAFAEGALVYERAYAASSWTLPSHASLFTGLLPMQHGAQSVPDGPDSSLGYGVRPLAGSFTTIAERLAERGYRTGAVVAGPALRRELGLDQGFEVYDDTLDAPGERLHGKRAEKVADRAIDVLESFGEAPYFLFVNFFDPHAPYEPPPPFDVGVPAAARAGAANEAKLIGRLLARLAADEPARAVADLDEDLVTVLAAKLAGYDGEIAYMDHHLGRLLEAVAARPDATDTLIVITADHGESFGEHYYVSHGAHLYEHNVRVPLLLRWPDGRAGRVPVPVQAHDVLAAALHELGLGPVPDPVGAIVLEVHRSESNIRMFGATFDRDLRAVVVDRYKRIESTTGEAELYDLAADPHELVNLASVEPEITRRLGLRLEAVRQARPPMFETDRRAELRAETAEALRALGYLD